MPILRKVRGYKPNEKLSQGISRDLKQNYLTKSLEEECDNDINKIIVTKKKGLYSLIKLPSWRKNGIIRT